MIYAIDFGTSNSLISVASGNQNYPLLPMDPLAKDPAILRSLIYFDNKKSVHFGHSARKEFLENSMEGRLLKSFKRFLPIKNFEGTIIWGKEWTLEDIICRFLKEMRDRANLHLDKDIDSVVLGRPALFSEDKDLDALAQNRMLGAAQRAGFKHIEFLPEPVAAAYRYRLEMKEEELVLVADFGGGTSDFTLLKLSQNNFRPEDVLAIGGAAVAGDALDGAIMKHPVAKNFGAEVSYTVPMGSNILHMPKMLSSHLCSTAYIQLLNSKENRDFLKRVGSWSLGPNDRKYMQQLETLLDNQLGFSVFEAIEECKRKISTESTVNFSYEYPSIAIKERVTQKQFQESTKTEITKIFSALDETLQRAGVSASQVKRVCCTGGSAQVALIKGELLKRFPADRLDNYRNFTSIVEGLVERGRQLQA